MIMLVAVGMVASMVSAPCLGIVLAAKHEKPDHRKSEKNLHHPFAPVFGIIPIRFARSGE
jgi:hypothetical protein